MPLSQSHAETLSHVPTIQLVESLKQIERHTRSHKKAILHFDFLAQIIETELLTRAQTAATIHNITIPCKL